MSETNPALGILLRLLSGLLFAAMAVTVKRLGDTVPLGEIVFFRSVFAMILVVIFLWMRREFPDGLRKGRPWEHVLRSLLGVGPLRFNARRSRAGRDEPADVQLFPRWHRIRAGNGRDLQCLRPACPARRPAVPARRHSRFGGSAQTQGPWWRVGRSGNGRSRLQP
ncbi:EamA family transporter [Rhodobacteraceae bacterium]|nr:EamA family transporter [Paracoccaceae bacterium]